MYSVIKNFNKAEYIAKNAIKNSDEIAAGIKGVGNTGDNIIDCTDEIINGGSKSVVDIIEGASTTTKPNQVHHFASNKSSKYTSQFENITNKYGLDLDDVWNKELMPHQGRHPYAYHVYILDNMQKFDKIANGD
ncbi:MAG: hypothetical protein K0R15_2583 [Clostridiales bacterium]|jgi:hypothetical protein|nr:hypothetical protein [Clostridiales bacterium]